MNRFCLLIAAVLLAAPGWGSWYWPFGSSDEGDAHEPRLSELMQPASELIDEASDLASDGKSSDAIAKYRAALKELDRLEAENPERVKRPEFATLRNKRAYVNAAIDSLMMSQVKDNARPVAVSDTTELERRLAEEKKAKAKKAAEKPKKSAEGKKKSAKKDDDEEKPDEDDEESDADDETKEAKSAEKAKKSAPPAAASPREQALRALAKGDYKTAAVCIEEMLVAKPNDVAALNLRAAMEAAQGKFEAAEATLDEAIRAHPRNPYAYYNMARLILQSNPAGKSNAKRYYETGRALGGPADPALEAQLK